MATPLIKNSESTKKFEAPEAKAPEAKTQKVKSVVTKITLSNPYTKVRVYPDTPTDNIVADNWWESQVSAGLAKWL